MRVPVVFSIIAASSLRSSRAVNASAFVIHPSGKIHSSSTTTLQGSMVDPEYPGTAVERMMNARARVAELAQTNAFNGEWEEVRRKILWAGGLKDLPNAIPGQGYTGHSFNDYNHVDLTCMRDGDSDNENDGSVKGILIGNRLGNGIRVASLPELGPGGRYVQLTKTQGFSKECVDLMTEISVGRPA